MEDYCSRYISQSVMNAQYSYIFSIHRLVLFCFVFVVVDVAAAILFDFVLSKLNFC